MQPITQQQTSANVSQIKHSLAMVHVYHALSTQRIIQQHLTVHVQILIKYITTQTTLVLVDLSARQPYNLEHASCVQSILLI